MHVSPNEGGVARVHDSFNKERMASVHISPRLGCVASVTFSFSKVGVASVLASVPI